MIRSDWLGRDLASCGEEARGVHDDAPQKVDLGIVLVTRFSGEVVVAVVDQASQTRP